MKKRIQMGDSMKYIVDRIEGNYAVCEVGEDIVNIKLEYLPKEVKEGDIIVYKDNEYYIDKTLKEERMKEILDKMNDVWEN